MAILTACVAAIALLHRPISMMDTVLWGPADPWNNGDFLGAHWLFWAESQPNNPAALLNWPWGEQHLLSSFPNPFDAWILGPLFARVDFPLSWNLMMLSHHLLNIVGTVCIARSAGARALHAAAAGALVAATPIMLHEHAMGHTITAAIWPALFGIAALIKQKDLTAGFWLGIQGLAYLYTGIAAGLIALIVRPARGLILAPLICTPYLMLLLPELEAASAIGPPDGFTGLPLSGLFGISGQHHIQFYPLLLIAIGAWFWGNKKTQVLRHRLFIASSIVILFALGPEIFIKRGAAQSWPSPLSFFFEIPGLSRMHHPIRLGMLAVPLLATLVALSINRRRSIWALILIGLTTFQWRTIDNTAAWSASGTIPGDKVASWLKKNSTGVVDLGSQGMEALSLQTLHGKPILSGFHPRTNPRPGVDASIFERVELWSQGERQPRLPNRLKQLGYSHVIIIDRGPEKTPSKKAIQAQLGPEVFPGIYAL